MAFNLTLKKKFQTLTLALLSLAATSAHAVPMDVHGVFGAGATLIDSYTRIDNLLGNNPGTLGSEEVSLASGKHANASFQNYIFRINPEIVINDSVTFHSEITHGNNRGNFFGDNSVNNQESKTKNSFGNSLYLHSRTTGDKSLYLNKAYIELFSDTATYIIGRHTSHWGLGAVYHNGEGTWDRHTNTRDGVTLKIKLGNFYISPYWAKIDSGDSLTRATRVKEYGVSLLYDNIDRDIAFGILYTKKQSSILSTSEQADINNTGTLTSLGGASVKITDLYIRKSFGKFAFGVEFPLISGDVGTLYDANAKTKFKSKALIAESSYQISTSWKLGFDLGRVSGDNGGTSSFDAMYLNPNYQIANLLFRYNLRAIANPGSIGIYDSYITNTNYYKLSGTYESEKWRWNAAFIMAWADEVAKDGQTSYDHNLNQNFKANGTQDDFLGHEIDLSFDYHWNTEVDVGGSLGYLFTGDYFGYSNSAVKNNTKNSFALELKTAVRF